MSLVTAQNLCTFCRSITFQDLVSGFQHGLSYSAMLQSAGTCPLCLIFVYSFSKLQLPRPDVILDDYDTWKGKLLTTKYFKRKIGPLGRPFDTLEDPPDRLRWKPHSDAAGERIDRGSVDDGRSIQVFAPQR
jgi:hypothetical protein